MTASTLVTLRIETGVAWLGLNRPEKRNALNLEMIEQLRLRCGEIEAGPARVTVLSGTGGAFCAGGDIGAWGSLSPDEFSRDWIRAGHVAFDAVARLRTPVIAVLDGDTLGGGLELAACADCRVAEEQIRIGQPETGIGVVPGWSGTQRLVRRFGAQPVRRMALLGEVFTASEALALGIVDSLVPTGGGLAAAEELARKLASRPQRATEITKMMINAAEGEEHERVIDSLAGAVVAGTKDLAEGIAAFREKRPPVFDQNDD